MTMSLPLDPSESVGTPEYEEIFKEQHDRRRMLLDLLQEQHDADQLQFPYRVSHS